MGKDQISTHLGLVFFFFFSNIADTWLNIWMLCPLIRRANCSHKYFDLG